MSNKINYTNATILFILALIIRVSIISLHGFDGLYGQDAFAYYNFAGDILNFVNTFQPPPPFFWSIGYPLQLAGGFSIFGMSEGFALSINILMGSLLPVLVYVLARQFDLNTSYAFFVGLIIVFSGQALQSSLVIMSDVPALFWALFSLITLLQYLGTDQPRWIPFSALAISLAFLTRWIYLILLPVYAIGLITRWRWKRIRDILLAILVAAVPIIPQLFYNRFNPTPLIDHAWVQGWSPLNVFSSNFVNIDGTFYYEQINAIFYAYPLYDARYLSPLLTIFILIGTAILLKQRTYKALLLFGWIILPYVFLTGIPYQNIRFPLILFPPLVIVAGIGLQQISRGYYRLRWVMIAIALLGCLHTAIDGFRYANDFVAYHQSEKQVVDWLDGKIPENGILYTFGSTLTLNHYTDYSIIEIFYETPNTLNQRWFRGRTDYLLLNLWQIENQWQGRTPQDNYHWFRDERGLTEIGNYRNLTLFEASP